MANPIDNSAPPGSLCAVRLSAIGDTCHTLPVLRTLKAAWPETAITWIIGRTEASLMADIPEFEFITFDKSAGLAGYRELRRRLAGRRFDVLLMMHASLRANAASRLIPARRRIGFDRERARDLQWLVSDERIPHRSREHVMDGLFGFAEYLGVRERHLAWDIPVSDADREYAVGHLPAGRPWMLLSPCSSQRARNYRNWSVANYARLVDHAAERHGAGTVITGGPTALEREYGEAITAAAANTPVNLVGASTLKQLFALIRRATVVVCPDSGPAHMATAAATPVIGLYATSNPDRTGPYLSRHLVVNAYPEAVRQEFGRPVSEIAWGRRVRDPAAMDLIRAGTVEARLDEVLGGAAPAA
ncbi:glycosyltransferase family 9 protein [Lentisalinibacter sediminis]|uniref:glycosyltransferase family 9 protein n=1 Tax=Lentisalinibacter sediminis TaxID=2992237 RepID=UPI003869654E